MTAAPLHLCGERLMLDPAGALYWPARRAVVVSDLHLEKGSAFASRGMLLPPWDTRATLDRLLLLLRHWRPEMLVLLGDSFHDATGAQRLTHEDAMRLREIAARLRLVWIAGNHDPAAPTALGGEATEALALGSLVFRHQAAAGAPAGEISGHYHPKATVATRGTRIRRPCFVADAGRLLMPAFGAYAGGLDIRDAAIARLFPGGCQVFLLGPERLYCFPTLGACSGQARGALTRLW